MLINTQAACALLRENDNFVILAHHKPDGDTLGSCFALQFTLQKLGKRARVLSPDGFSERYAFLYGQYNPEAFEPGYIVTADVASLSLLGCYEEAYGGRIDLCIDHHKSNELPAQHTLLDAEAPATALIMYRLILELGVAVDKPIANALFTGLSTDTGCFKYDNVTPETHRTAAALIEAGADHGMINKLMFDTKSRARLEVEKLILESLEYYFDGASAVMTVPAGLPERYGVTEEELDGISALPRRIEGVKAGVTMRERGDGEVRISLRTGDGLDASSICSRLGGGGHKNAAGCTLTGTRDEVRARVLEEIGRELERLQS